MKILAPLVVGGLLALFASPVQAQEPGPPAPLFEPDKPNPDDREGFLVGLAFGVGNLSVAGESHGSSNYGLEFGGFLTHRIALLLRIWGGVHTDGSFELSNHNKGLGLQYWASKSFWVSGAVGTATLTAQYDNGFMQSVDGVSLSTGLGWEFYKISKFQFVAGANLSLEGYEDQRENVTSMALQVGLQYY